MIIGVKELVLSAKALADPSRVRILMSLRKEELCVCELCDALRLTQSTLSTHLRVIRDAGLVSARKEGKWMYYALAPEAKQFVQLLFRTFAASLSADTTLRRDERELQRRLKLRDHGSCCVGFRDAKSCSGAIKK
jgi:ArsR family transcriptional regulator, arsenate/arsenite/antimonite-responsive transcriptional repressor